MAASPPSIMTTNRGIFFTSASQGSRVLRYSLYRFRVAEALMHGI
jgi:hypothetical protein